MTKLLNQSDIYVSVNNIRELNCELVAAHFCCSDNYIIILEKEQRRYDCKQQQTCIGLSKSNCRIVQLNYFNITLLCCIQPMFFISPLIGEKRSLQFISISQYFITKLINL